MMNKSTYAPRVYLGGAGGAPTNNVIRSIRCSGSEFLIGASCSPTDLFLADVDERYYIPVATHTNYRNALLSLLRKSNPDFIHCQNDFEIRALSRFRGDLAAIGVKHFMPKHEVIENCV